MFILWENFQNQAIREFVEEKSGDSRTKGPAMKAQPVGRTIRTD
ncbi:hypothetical protein NSS79_22290 [Paenibacillus sp. FSL L8-0436]